MAVSRRRKKARKQTKQRKVARANLQFEKLEPRQMLATMSPVIDEVLISGIDWSGTFQDKLENDGLGTNGGYSLTDNADGVLPWTNLNQLSVHFSQDVNIQSGDLVGQGINAGVIAAPTGDSFSYDSESFIATWTFNSSLQADRFAFRLADTIANSMDLPIDGELAFSFDVVPSDGDRSGATGVQDGLDLRSRLFSNTTSGDRYSIFYDVDGSGAINVLDGLNVRANLFDRLPDGSLDLTGPSITAALANDTAATGSTNSDRITADASIAGQVSDPLGVSSLVAIVDGGSPIAINVDFNGTFSFDPTNLPGFADGNHVVQFVARDAFGNPNSFDLNFKLDRQDPTLPLLELSAGSGIVADQTSNAGRVTLTGSTDANITVGLAPLALTSLSANTGVVQFASVPLSIGANLFTIVATDTAGNTTQGQITINRVEQVGQQDPVLRWNQVLLKAITLDASAPTVASRAMAMVHSAVYDAVAAIETRPGYYVSQAAPTGASLEAAVSGAAHRVLSYLYPGQRSLLDTTLTAALVQVPDGSAETSGLTFGESVANSIIALRSNDGWNSFVDYVAGSGPGVWEPTAPSYSVALDPQWANLQPFAITSSDQFSPLGPPGLTTAEWATAYNEVKSLGSTGSTTRTADQTQIARFWADGAGTSTPPGHWNTIAEQAAIASGNSISENARLFAELNIALGDAAIVAWNSKYEYEFWRPDTAIHRGDTDGNAATNADQAWTPLVISPPFPEYVSGHSTYSGAAAAILTAEFGDNYAFSTTTESLPGVTRSFTSFEAAAAEAGRSRVYGGIHFDFSNVDGLAAGSQLAEYVLETFTTSTDALPPNIIIDGPAEGLASKQNITISGRVLDNVSGVSLLEARLDGGSYAPVMFDVNGNFTYQTSLLLDGSNDGQHTLHLRATDFANNASNEKPFAFTLDTVTPTLTVDSPVEGASLAAGDRLMGSVAGTGSPLVSLTYSFDGGNAMPFLASPAGGAFNVPLDLMQLSVGSHDLTVTARDAAGNETVVNRTVSLSTLTPLTIVQVTPASGSNEIGTTYRPQVFFSRPVDAATLNPSNFYATDTTGAKIPATIVPSLDGTFAWLFFTAPLPGASTITVHVIGDSILAQGTGQALDADGDGTVGGSNTYQFTTVALEPLANTSLSGRVFDPGVDLKPMTTDDFLAGPDGALHTSDDLFLNPLAGVRVFILGLEDQAVVTDSEGRFNFSAVPGGNIKLAIDGQTATNAPTGFYFPEMVMDLDLVIGQANTVMGTMGTREARSANLDRTEIYLPRLESSILKPISDSDPTMVGVDAVSAPNLTDEQREFLQLEVQPGSLIGADGQPVASGEVGISAVPPELVREMLPAGLLQHTFDITIQAPNAATFAVPLEMTFPNVFNAAPGTKLNFLSFDHTSGRLVIEGTATVSANGKSVTTDPGMGITKPGWHGLTPPGSSGGGGGGPNGPPGCGGGGGGSGGDGTLGGGRGPVFVGGAAGVAGNILKGVTLNILNLLKNPFNPNNIKNGFNAYQNAFEDAIKAAEYSRDLQQYYLDLQLWDPDDGSPRPKCPSPPSSSSGLSAKLTAQSRTVESPIETGDSSPIETGDSRIDQGLAEIDRLIDLMTLDMNTFDSLVAAIGDAEDESDLSPEQKSEIDTLVSQFNSEQAGLSPERYYEQELQTLRGLQDLVIADESYNLLNSDIGYYAIEDLSTGFVIRGTASADSLIEDVFLSPDTDYRIVRYFPQSNALGETFFRSRSSGAFTGLPPGGLVVDSNDLLDNDGDGLAELAEFAIGTHPDLADTDGDGITDLAEIAQGLDPLSGRSFPTGIIATQNLLGESIEVVVEGSSLNTDNQTAYVATGSYGLAIVDTSQFQQPVVQSQLDLPGNNVGIAVDETRNLAVLAGGEAGVHIVDIADPSAPILTQTVQLSGGASRVEVFDGIIYAGSKQSDKLSVFDLTTGELIQSLTINGGVTDLAREGEVLYVLTANSQLRTVDLSNFNATLRGSLNLPEAGSKVFVGNGIAYIGAGVGFGQGFMTANVFDPDSLSMLSGVDANNIAGRSVVSNGSDLGIAVGDLGFGVGSVLHIVDVSDPTNTNAFVTQFAIPSDPQSVALGAGIAFVANGQNGLQVVNYRSFDTLGQAPSVSISSSVVDVDGISSGIQVVEGSSIPVVVSISDDVQVRNVELLVNGQVTDNDVAFPFDFIAIAPTLASDVTTVAIQVRATDTGGNQSLSNLLTYDLVPDTIAPTVVGTTPEAGQDVFFTPSIDVRFDEALDETLIDVAGVALTFLGTDGVIGGGDDVNVTLSSVEARSLGRRLSIYPTSVLDTGNYLLTLDPSIVADRAGNRIADPHSFQFTVRPASDLRASSGFPAIGRAPAANVGQEIGFPFPGGVDNNLRLTFPTIDGSGNSGFDSVAPSRLDLGTDTAYFIVPAGATTGEINSSRLGENNFTAFQNWDVTDGSVDLLGPGNSDPLPGNGLYVDLDGSTGNGGRLESKTAFLLTPGTYELKFSLAGSQQSDSNTVSVNLGGVFSEQFTLSANDPLTTIARTIVVSDETTAKLVFDQQGSDNSGLLLDNVVLTNISTSVVLLDDNFDFTFADGTLPLQIVPTLSDVNLNSSVFHEGQLTLQGTGFVEGGVTIHFGADSISDDSASSSPIDVGFHFAQENDGISLTVPNGVPTGPISVTTLGGTSAAFQLTFTGIASTANTGTPADASEASANPGQSVTITGSELNAETDILTQYADISGTVKSELHNPSFVNTEGTEATFTVPDYYNGAYSVRIVGSAERHLLQIVPVLQNVDFTSFAADGSSAEVTLRGAGFIEANGSVYTFGNVSVTDDDISSNPIDVGAYFVHDGDGAQLTLPTTGDFEGAVTVTTAGGTSTPFTIDTSLNSTANTGTPADVLQASANTGQSVTITGSDLNDETDILTQYVNNNGTVRSELLNPSFVNTEGTEATFVVPDYYNGAFEVRVVGSTEKHLLQIVPVLQNVDFTSFAADGSSAEVTLRGAGFIEANGSVYTFGNVSVTDDDISSNPIDVGAYFVHDGDGAQLTLPTTGDFEGAVTVTTAGGTSTPFTIDTSLNSTANTGTPADVLQASANTGQSVTITGSDLNDETDILTQYVNNNGTVRSELLNPSFVNTEGTEATFVVPDYYNGAFEVRVVGSTEKHLLQIVPVLQNVDFTSFTTDGSSAEVTLRGAGFIEANGSVYTFGNVSVTDDDISSNPIDVGAYFVHDGDGAQLTLPTTGDFEGAVTVTTAGGTSTPFTIDTSLNSTANTGTPADVLQASANTGQSVTITGSDLNDETDILTQYVNNNGTVRSELLNPSFVNTEGTEATFVVPDYYNGAFEVRVVGSTEKHLLQIVPVLQNVDFTSFTTDGSSAEVTLRGAGFIEANGSVYTFGNVSVTDDDISSNPIDVGAYFVHDGDGAQLTLPTTGDFEGAVTVTTAGGTSTPFTIDTSLNSNANTFEATAMPVLSMSDFDERETIAVRNSLTVSPPQPLVNLPPENSDVFLIERAFAAITQVKNTDSVDDIFAEDDWWL